MNEAVKKDLIPALAWGSIMIGVALGAAWAHREGYIDADTKTRVIAMNGLWLAWYGNRMPKAFVPSAWARQARRFAGWVLALSGPVYAGLFAFAPIPIAMTFGIGVVAAGIAVTFGNCLRLAARAKAA